MYVCVCSNVERYVQVTRIITGAISKMNDACYVKYIYQYYEAAVEIWLVLITGTIQSITKVSSKNGPVTLNNYLRCRM